MRLFGFGKKKQEEKSCCGDDSIKCCSSDSKNSRFIVLGDCCKKALETFENTLNCKIYLPKMDSH